MCLYDFMYYKLQRNRWQIGKPALIQHYYISSIKLSVGSSVFPMKVNVVKKEHEAESWTVNLHWHLVQTNYKEVESEDWIVNSYCHPFKMDYNEHGANNFLANTYYHISKVDNNKHEDISRIVYRFCLLNIFLFGFKSY